MANFKNVFFQNKKGQKLAARIEFPENDEPKGYALFAHCFTCNKNLTAVRTIGKSLNQSGIAVFRFDFTGLGESEGLFENTNFSSNVDDLISASDFLRNEYQAQSILIGHSLGGAAVIFAANKIEEVKAVATIGAPSSPKHISHLLQSGLEEIRTQGEAILSIGGRPFKIQKQFLEDINEKNMAQTLKLMRLPLAVFHSPQDDTVGIENAAEIYQHAWHPKSFISLDGADHLLSNRKDSNYVGKIIATWSERYIN